MDLLRSEATGAWRGSSDSLPYELLLDKAYFILKFLFKKIDLSAFERDGPLCHQDQVLYFICFLGVRSCGNFLRNSRTKYAEPSGSTKACFKTFRVVAGCLGYLS